MGFEFPDIDPVAVSLGPLDIRWYALAYLAGFLLGWKYCISLAKRDRALRPFPDDIDDYLPWAMAGVILGGRIGYVLFYQPMLYLHDPLAALKIWQGGMSFHGGALGVIIATVIFCYLRKIPLLRMTDLVASVAPIGLFFGRLANFVNGELYGRVTSVPWAVHFPRGGDVYRHPSQIYEALLEGVLLFTVLFILARREGIRKRPGILSGVFLIGYGAARAFVELFRQPDKQIGFIWNVLSMGQILSAPMILAGAFLIVYGLKKSGAPHASS